MILLVILSKKPAKNLRACSNYALETMHLADLLELSCWDPLAQEERRQLKLSAKDSDL